MKLNKKVSLLITPVLMVSFFLTAGGLYIIERNSIYTRARSSVELEATELSESLTKYTLVANGFLTSLIQSDTLSRFLETEDKQIRSMALGADLDNILKTLEALSSKRFTILFLNASGDLEYYYENSLDPFAEPNTALMQWAQKPWKQEPVYSSQYLTEVKLIGLSRTVNRMTLKTTSDYSSEYSLTIVVALDPTDFIERSESLRKKFRKVAFYDKQEQLPEISQFESRKIVPLGTITVQIDKETVESDLWQIFFKLGLSFVVLGILSHLALRWLLGRYVLQPIYRLEQQMSSADLDGTQDIKIHPANDEIGNLSKAFSLLYSKLKETYEKTKDLAERDSLTTLYNRRVFNMILEKILSRAKISKKQVALMYIDIDNFKFVNDNYGHGAGDELLRAFAFRMHEIVRGSDVIVNMQEDGATAARLAGDEFAVIIHDYSDDDAPRKVAQRLLELCKDGFTCEAGTFPITLSIGVATFPKDSDTAANLILNADSAMYESKKSGKNTISYYSKELSDFARRQQALEMSLKNINTEELELYYMPIVDTMTEKTTSLEALVRWFSPDLGPISPAEFIPLAESIGTYHEIDLWVVERAFQESARIMEHFGHSVRISINISAAEFSRGDFETKLNDLIEKYAVNPSMFVIEITETFYQRNSDMELQLLNAMQQAGFQLAIDDFGSGYTSLLQLVEFPVDIVKIDRIFIDKIIAGNKYSVLKSLVDFCHAQHLKVTAEGVETEVYVEVLKNSGVDCLQGFYYSRPRPIEELITSCHRYIP